MRDFNYLYINRAEGCAHSAKGPHFLNVMQDNFQMVVSPIEDNDLLNLLITKNTQPITHVEVRDTVTRCTPYCMKLNGIKFMQQRTSKRNALRTY